MTRGRSGVPTGKEVEAALTWLGKRGVRVAVPTPLLGIRVGAQVLRWDGREIGRYFGYLVVAGVLWFGYLKLWNSAGVNDRDMMQSGVPGFLMLGIQITLWHQFRARERRIAARLGEHVVRPDVRSRLRLLGGWYWTAMALAFGGGTVLGIGIIVAAPDARWYGWSWLAYLGLSALCCLLALVSVVRTPVISEDEVSRAVDTSLWLEYIYAAAGMYAVYPLAFDLLLGTWVSGFAGWEVGYVVLTVGIQVVGIVLHRLRSRVLPPGNYGPPEPVRSQREIDWTPPSPG